ALASPETGPGRSRWRRPIHDFGEEAACVAAGYFLVRHGVGRGSAAGRLETLPPGVHPRRDHQADAAGAGRHAEHQRGIGNTAILLNALESRSIDVYPEYTGTIAREILKLPDVPPLAQLNARLAPRGLGVAVPLGVT